jgi:hypothetical protein
MSYKIAWPVKRMSLQTMLSREEKSHLDGRVEIDDAYLGGERPGKRGRGAESKTPFVAAIQINSEGRPDFMRLTPVAGFTYEALKQWSTECLSPTANVVSDGLGCFKAVTHTAAQHERNVVGSGKLAVQRGEFRWVNTLTWQSRDRAQRNIPCI